MEVRKTTLKLALGAGCALAVLAAASATQAEERTFNLASSRATDSIPEFARQAGLQIVAPAEKLRGVNTPAIEGRYDTREALALLIEGTGLQIASDDGRTITLAQSPQSGSASDGADGTVEALIVTAQKREEDIQDVPIAISAFTQEDLTRSQVAGGPDLMTQVPNFTFTKTNFSSYSIQIRGIGTQAISATTDPAVAVAFNNTPFIRNRFFEQEFYDLERVEVLRGPQGTLYGRNATAGVVNIISAKPSFQYEAKLSGDVSNYNSTRLEGMINLPLSANDDFALRIAGAWTKREGYVKNILTGEQTDGRNLWSTRVSLRGAPTDWLDINLIWEHFEEDDDRLRSGKQLCRADPGPSEVAGQPVEPIGGAINFGVSYFSQGCLPTSLYSPDAFQTPNGYALPYYGPLQQIGSPVFILLNPYANELQSRDLREIETHLTPVYEASTDLVELQLDIDLPGNLTLASETGYLRDRVFSFQDLNRFDTTPGVFVPGGRFGDRFDIISENGVFCDPQLGCTDRLAAGDLSTARSRHFSQEFRLSSNYDGPFNFNLGANFLRYDTEDKYYVFVNTLTAYSAGADNGSVAPWIPGVQDNFACLTGDYVGWRTSPKEDVRNFYGDMPSDPNQVYFVEDCQYIDPNDIHNLNDLGRNYFLSRNPYHLLSYAAFGEAYFQLAPNLKLTTGLRWTVDKKQAPQMPSWTLAGGSFGEATRKVINLEWREPTGRIALDWKPDLAFTDETLLYASYVRGYKAGGANPPPAMIVLSAQVCSIGCAGSRLNDLILDASLTHPEKFDAEYVDAFETGTKNTVLDGRLTANLSAFYYDYRGYQISQIVNRSAVNLNFDAEVWGAELEVDWRPLENLRLGFKGGWENTRMADGSQAIDLMDRTAGKEGWILVRPFPSLTANCVAPEWLLGYAFMLNVCAAYETGLDPATYLPYVPNPTLEANPSTGEIQPLSARLEGYPGYDPTSMANGNRGEGFLKDLSGNELPNAPDYTATITADYTLPLPHDWLMTLHTDLYYQSEAWTRIFNTDGYDKLKAFSNINLAAIFSNEDAGWTVMAYVKNVLDKDNITGAFLFSDDVGLTTNVFLNEPRLYGIRVTKEWTGGGDWWGGLFPNHQGGAPYPITVEVAGQNQRLDASQEPGLAFVDAFPTVDIAGLQSDDHLNWNDGRDLRLTYQPSGSPWKVTAGVRYGRADGGHRKLRQEDIAGPEVCRSKREGKYNDLFPGVDFGFIGKLQCDPDYPPVTMTFDTKYGPFTQTFENKYDPDNLVTPINRIGASGARREEHLILDFEVGKDVGLGFLGEGRSSLAAGVRYAEFESSASGDLRGVPDLYVPEGWAKYDTTFTQYMASFEAEREFNGLGPVLSWQASQRVLGDAQNGSLNLDWTVAGGALFGKQRTTISGDQGSEYTAVGYQSIDWDDLAPPALTPIQDSRSESATVPLLDLSLGLSYEIQRFKVGAGYRWERYFDVLDAGFAEHRSYDRTIDGPYVKLSVGFGG